MSTKARKTFSINNFRGLDKENKLLKVASFRASDGDNFIIDSETLKTRPAFKYNDILPFDIETGDILIDWYEFREVKIFITKNHIYVYDGETVKNELHDDVISDGLIGSFNFESSKPLFKEEKECLFIFNVGFIYVFSILRDINLNISKYVIYQLSSKPTNPYQKNDFYFEQYDELPIPYEPTIFIGDNRFDDPNLLSKVSKYKLFASTRDAIEGKTTYNLPTVYEEAKHGFYTFLIEFYQGKFAENGIYPIFMGKENENFTPETSIPVDYGTTLNPSDPFVIEDIFFPKEDFEFIGAPGAITDTISEIIGLTKEWFFKSKVTNEDKQVFTHLLDYINNDQALDTPLITGNNKTLKYSVPVKYNAVYKDATSNNVVGRFVEETTIDIYVQLRLFEIDSVAFNSKLYYRNLDAKLYTESLGDDYPAYPSADETGKTVIELYDGNPRNEPGFTEDTFKNLVDDYLKLHSLDYSDNQELIVKAKLYEGASNVQESLANADSNNDWIFKEISGIINELTLVNPDPKLKEYTLTTPFPDYPYTAFVHDTLIDLHASPQQVTNFDEAYFIAECEAYILANESNFSDGEKVLLRAQYKDYLTDALTESITPVAFTSWLFATLASLNNPVIGDVTKSAKSNVLPSYPSYPSYPVVAGDYTVIDLPSNPYNVTGYDENTFIALCEAYISANSTDFTDGQLVKFRGQFYEASTIVTQESINAEISSNWIFKELNELQDESYTGSAEVEEHDLGDPYPAYPTVDETGKTVIVLPINPFLVSDLTEAIAIIKCEDYFDDNIGSFNDNQELLFKGQYYKEVEAEHQESVDTNTSNWEYSITGQVDDSLPVQYPNVADPSSGAEESIIRTTPLLFVGSDTFNLNDVAFENAVISQINIDISSFTLDEGSGWCRVQAKTIWDTYYKTMTAWIPFIYTKASGGNYEIRKSFIITATVQKGIEDKVGITLNNTSTFPSRPYLANPSGYQVLDRGILYTFTGTTVDFTNSNLYDAIETEISDNLASMNDDNGYGYMRFYIQLNHSSGSAFDTGYAVAVKFYFEKAGETASESRQSMILVGSIQKLVHEKLDITIDNPATFPAYPYFNFGSIEYYDLGIIHTGTIENINFADAGLITDLTNAISAVLDEQFTPNDGYAYVKFKVQTQWSGNVKGYSMIAKFDYQKAVSSPYEYRQSMIMTLEIDRIIYEKSITLDDPATFPAYPSFENPSSYDVLDLGIVFTGTSQYIDYTSETLKNAIESQIIAVIDTLTGASGNGFAKLKIQSSYGSVNTGVSLVVGFYFQKTVTTPFEYRQVFLMTTTVDTTQQMANEGVYEYTYDDKEKAFVVKIRDYFFDYNDEPSIDIKISFQNNPDYKKIINNTIGTTFGSENRLFLSGDLNYPNIDRFNVSNDLLGDNVKNQSYELSYFPSKNYRVIGGKGAINGYVVATDSHLYVTKEKYPNDEKLFIRERILDKDGVVGYNEYKTSVKVTPLNENCIVRFYNDILILSEDGLYGVEISSNVLTDERLVKPRDGFIKKDLIKTIKAYDKSKIFMVENDMYLYIFIGDDVYVADSRYTAENENGEVGNFSYEIVKWKLNNTYEKGKIEDQEVVLLDNVGKGMYKLVESEDEDDLVTRYNNLLSLYSIQGSTKNAFIIPLAQEFVFDNPLDYIFKLKEGYKVIGIEGTDYHVENGEIIVDNEMAFRNISDGDDVFFKESDGVGFVANEVDGYDAEGVSFGYNDQLSLNLTKIYMNIADIDLRISFIFDFDNNKYFRLTPFIADEVANISQNEDETTENYLIRLDTYLLDNNDYDFSVDGLQDCYINEPEEIVLNWVSAITNLGSKLMEKTMYRANIYASRQSKGNKIIFGYKTMRKASYESTYERDVSNQSNLESLDFNSFGLNTFSEFGTSLPLKENNFLYIQFSIIGTGQIELNSMDIIYKLNRALKSIG